MIIRPMLVMSIVLVISPVASAAKIDFGSLSVADISDANGQTFAWTGGGTSGSVVVRANWTSVSSIDGALRTDTQGPTSFSNPFVGTVTFAFSQPVQIDLTSTISSLIRDGLNGGRFERVALSTADPIAFSPLVGTTAEYTGAGTNSIVADDTFSPTPTTSNWGFVGSGPASHYQLQYTSTSIGLSETFNVFIVPEPTSIGYAIVGVAGLLCTLGQRTPKRALLCHDL